MMFGSPAHKPTRLPLERLAPYHPPHNKVGRFTNYKHATGKTVTSGKSTLLPAVHPDGTPASSPTKPLYSPQYTTKRTNLNRNGQDY